MHVKWTIIINLKPVFYFEFLVYKSAVAAGSSKPCLLIEE